MLSERTNEAPPDCASPSTCRITHLSMEVARMFRTKYFAAMVAAILTVFATGCIVSFEPETAVNPVGTEHTVTVTLREPDAITQDVLCDIVTDALEDLEDVFEEEGIPPLEGDPCLILPVGSAQNGDA